MEKELYQQAYNLFLKDTVDNNLKTSPVSIEAFGGRVPRFKLPEIWTFRAQNKLPKFRSDNRRLLNREKLLNLAIRPLPA